MVKEFLDGMIIHIMMVNLERMHLKVMVNIIGLMGNGIKDNGLKEICKVRENSFQMANSIKVVKINNFRRVCEG